MIERLCGTQLLTGVKPQHWCHHFMKLLVIRIPLRYNYSELAGNEKPGTTCILSHVCLFLTCHILKVT